MIDEQYFFERRAREERARAAACRNPVLARSFRLHAEDFQRRANACLTRS